MLISIQSKVITVLALVLSLLSLFASDAYGDSRRNQLVSVIEESALEEGAPPDLVVAVCIIESSLNPYATNFNDGGGRNSHGLCQVQYRTARWLGCANTVKELYSLKINSACAARYISYQLKRYDYYWPNAIASYNSGSIIKDRKGKLVNQVYVDKVMKVYRRLSK